MQFEVNFHRCHNLAAQIRFKNPLSFSIMAYDESTEVKVRVKTDLPLFLARGPIAVAELSHLVCLHTSNQHCGTYQAVQYIKFWFWLQTITKTVILTKKDYYQNTFVVLYFVMCSEWTLRTLPKAIRTLFLLRLFKKSAAAIKDGWRTRGAATIRDRPHEYAASRNMLSFWKKSL